MNRHACVRSHPPTGMRSNFHWCCQVTTPVDPSMGALGMFQGYPINKLAECADHSDSADSLGLFGHRRVSLFISDAFMQPDQLTDAIRNRPAVLVTEAVLQTFADSGGAGFAGGFEDFEAVGGADPLEDGSVGEFGEGVGENALESSPGWEWSGRFAPALSRPVLQGRSSDRSSAAPQFPGRSGARADGSCPWYNGCNAGSAHRGWSIKP